MNPQAGAPDAADRPPAGRDEGAPPLAEWIAAAVGLLLVLACAGVLGWHAWKGEAGPPQPSLQVGAIEALPGGGFLVRLQVRNAGSQAAADLHVSGELRSGDAAPERSQALIDHVPAGSSREAGLYFTQDPRQGSLTLRAEGYRTP
jgi:uncharacterized protein (TIGR02588 family)